MQHVHKINLASLPHPESDEFFELPLHKQFLYDDAYLFTEEATILNPDSPEESRVPCQQETDDTICLGAITLVRHTDPQLIQWKCDKCGYQGVITNFRFTPWDLTDESWEDMRQYLDIKYADPLEFADQEELQKEIEHYNQYAEWIENLSDEDFKLFQEQVRNELAEMDPAPVAGAGGLTPYELVELVTSDWTEGMNMLYLRPDISFDGLNKPFFLQNTLVFMDELQQQNGFDLTPSEYLKRKHVEALMERMIWPEGYIEEVRKYNKVFNEDNVWLLHTLRVLLDIAGLIRKSKGKYVPVKKRLHLFESGNEGALYQHIFDTYYKQMNMGFLTNSGGAELIQESTPYILYSMRRLNNDWHRISYIVDVCLLDVVKMDFLNRKQFEFQTPEKELYWLFLKSAELFGLVEVEHKITDKFRSDPVKMKKTPLFDRFIELHL